MTSPVSRKERERSARKHEMLRAATSIFAEKGYSGATLDEIAQRAEFGKGTLYNYFEGGKEDILKAILDNIYDDTLRICTEAFSDERLASVPLRTLFEDFLIQTFEYYTEQRDVFLIVLKEAHRMLFDHKDDMSEYLSGKRNQLVTALSKPLEYGMDTGQLRRMSVQPVAHLLLGNIKGSQMHRCLEARDHEGGVSSSYTAADQARFLSTILFDGLLDRSSNEHEATVRTIDV